MLCLFCQGNGLDVEAVVMAPQSTDLGRTVTFVPACQDHYETWWAEPEWDGSDLTRPIDPQETP